MKRNDFPFFLLLLGGCCLSMHLYYPGKFTFIAAISLGVLSGILLMADIYFGPKEEK